MLVRLITFTPVVFGQRNARLTRHRRAKQSFSALARGVPFGNARTEIMKTKLLVATLLAGSSLFAETHFSIGIGVGGHGYAAPPVMAYRPHSPGPGYVWVDGY